jgi:hypothetical protein
MIISLPKVVHILLEPTQKPKDKAVGAGNMKYLKNYYKAAVCKAEEIEG